MISLLSELSIIGQFSGCLTRPLTIYGDNAAALKTAQEGAISTRAKHIDIRHHFILEVIKRGDVLPWNTWRLSTTLQTWWPRVCTKWNIWSSPMLYLDCTSVLEPGRLRPRPQRPNTKSREAVSFNNSTRHKSRIIDLQFGKSDIIRLEQICQSPAFQISCRQPVCFASD